MLLLTILLFSGCKKHEPIKPKTVFDAYFTLLYNETQIKGEMSVKLDKTVEIEVTSPDTLKNMKISAKKGSFSVGYKGITVSYTQEELPDGVFYKLILLAFKNVLSVDKLEFKPVGEKYQATKPSLLGEIKITLNKDCYIERIEIPKQSFNLKLKVKNPS